MNKRLLVVKHSYKDGFGFPGGSIKSGEDHQAAAAQKLKEEVGLTVDPAQLQLVCMLPPTADYCGYADLFEARVRAGTALTVDDRRITDAGFLFPCDITDFDCQPIVTYYLRQLHHESEIRLLTETEQTST
jgi:8-oxo-dGTP pyrophosphatase MutT (NUDIX family)